MEQAGATDTVIAFYCPSREKKFGTDLYLTNKTGGVAPLQQNYVNAKKKRRLIHCVDGLC